jgi:DNA-binding NarL/FixJ family response regulator
MRILLINYNITLISSLEDFLEAFFDIVIVGAFRESEIALAEIPSLNPNFVLVDLDMQNLPGNELVQKLRRIAVGAVIVAIGTANTEKFRESILLAGADCYIPKARLAKDLVPAMREEISKLHGLNAAG